MYDAFLILSFFALLLSPYALNAWCDWREYRSERRRLELTTTRLAFVEELL